MQANLKGRQKGHIRVYDEIFRMCEYPPLWSHYFICCCLWLNNFTHSNSEIKMRKMVTFSHCETAENVLGRELFFAHYFTLNPPKINLCYPSPFDFNVYRCMYTLSQFSGRKIIFHSEDFHHFHVCFKEGFRRKKALWFWLLVIVSIIITALFVFPHPFDIHAKLLIFLSLFCMGHTRIIFLL